MRSRISFVLLGLMASTAVGCATLFAPGPDMVPVRSKPTGATVYLDNVASGTTPCVVPVPRSSEGVFRVELAGYQPVTVDRDKVVNGMTCLNLGWILFWPVVPVGYLIDGISGDIGKYSTNPIYVELMPVKRQLPPPPPEDLRP